jgi:tetratricopeptide (TPR) repeat protein
VPDLRTVLLSSLCILLASACATTRPTVVAAAPDTEPVAAAASAPEAGAPPAPAPRNPAHRTLADLDPQAQSQAQFHIMAGEMAAGRQQPEIAAQQFLQALTLIDDLELAQRATAMAAAARDESLAQQAAQRWLELEPNSGEAREVIARVALRRHDLASVETQARELIKGNAAGLNEGFRQVALILAQSDPDRQEEALKVMNDLVSDWPKLSGAHHAMGLLALRFGQLTLAESAASQARSLAPSDREHVLLLVAVYLKQERLADADAAAEALIKSDKEPAELRVAYARLLLDSDQRDAARTQLQQALAQKPDLIDARYALGMLAAGDRDYEAAAGYFRPLLDGPRAQDAAFELGRLAEARKRYDEALGYYDRVMRGPQALDAAVRRANIMARQDQLPQARELMRRLREQLPQLAQRFFLAEGEMLVALDRLSDAGALYDEALKEFPGDADLTYGRSLVHERQQRIDLAEQDLRSLIERDPEDARALNALGYMLTVHTTRYDEAHTLIARALQLDPDDPAIIDSMGWVQFKRGKVEDARAWLEKAFARFPDGEVAAHLGEVLWTLGDKDQARAVWAAALREDPDHSVLKETVQRLQR